MLRTRTILACLILIAAAPAASAHPSSPSVKHPVAAGQRGPHPAQIGGPAPRRAAVGGTALRQPH